MNFGEFSNQKAQQLLPPSLVSHEADLNHFQILCHELSIKLLRLLALGLKAGISTWSSNTALMIDRSNQGKVDINGFLLATTLPKALRVAYSVYSTTPP